jgi:hypothetical protein
MDGMECELKKKKKKKKKKNEKGFNGHQAWVKCWSILVDRYWLMIRVADNEIPEE